jgi:pimeloyl-ACP methyl ester carboxylesterase
MAAESLSGFVEMSRALLLAAGLARCESGGTVYWAGGSGQKTIVLVHGVNDQAGTWAAVASRLGKHAQLVVPDLPGHGESEPKTGPITMPFMLERLHAVIENERAEKITLVGNSMGAWLAILYTLQHPEKVERLVLESGGGLALPPGVPLVAANREEAIRIMEAVHGPGAPMPEWSLAALQVRSSETPFARVMAGGVFPYFVDTKLKELKVPTTIIWGAHDGVVNRGYVDKLHAGISGSTLKVIEGAAHIPHAQQPERFVECLTATF